MGEIFSPPYFSLDSFVFLITKKPKFQIHTSSWFITIRKKWVNDIWTYMNDLFIALHNKNDLDPHHFSWRNYLEDKGTSFHQLVCKRSGCGSITFMRGFISKLVSCICSSKPKCQTFKQYPEISYRKISISTCTPFHYILFWFFEFPARFDTSRNNKQLPITGSHISLMQGNADENYQPSAMTYIE